eukprot:2889044-Lingulodinium_polyedra.AAC.1
MTTHMMPRPGSKRWKGVPSPRTWTATSCNIVPCLGNCACQPASSTSDIIIFRCRCPSTRRSATYA